MKMPSDCLDIEALDFIVVMYDENTTLIKTDMPEKDIRNRLDLHLFGDNN